MLAFTTVAAYGSFLIAEHFHFSGVLASLTAGLVVGNIGPLGAISPRGKDALAAYWEYLGFVANSFIFMAIGIHLSRQNILGALAPAIVAILLVILGRACAVYPCCAVFLRSRLRVRGPHQHVLFWGGLRGALALALDPVIGADDAGDQAMADHVAVGETDERHPFDAADDAKSDDVKP